MISPEKKKKKPPLQDINRNAFLPGLIGKITGNDSQKRYA